MASDNGTHESQEESWYDSRTALYLEELLKEKHDMSTAANPHASRLLEQEVVKTKQTGLPTRDYRYIDIFREKPIKVVSKVIIPIREYPKFNFVGKLLGPKGNTLRRLQEETLCKMIILGRGSMKDKAKEEELRQGLDPKFAHLSDDLHIEVSALAPPSEAHARMSIALKELRKYLIPDSNDDISHEQLQEMESYMADTAPRNPKPYRGMGGRGAASAGGSKAKVLSILEKARNAMESVNHRGPPSHHQGHYERSYSRYDGNSEGYDTPHYEARGTNWGGGVMMASKARLPRPTPY